MSGRRLSRRNKLGGACRLNQTAQWVYCHEAIIFSGAKYRDLRIGLARRVQWFEIVALLNVCVAMAIRPRDLRWTTRTSQHAFTFLVLLCNFSLFVNSLRLSPIFPNSRIHLSSPNEPATSLVPRSGLRILVLHPCKFCY